ncbi:lipid-binding SYLF domain-containing protein [Sapientia aquatica]|uniref:Twin-arginine translocation pathway signal protein n=1 Tax=Sapientia aquatica TaxID=1549640 RepID=A0A4V3AUY0_9BURK|nr:lipid-binding SYLF domain-containing protein [Sapientia aquatica]TDK67118.1 twin-arginine translocation pathway signal protein [Sapientia aquatica]
MFSIRQLMSKYVLLAVTAVTLSATTGVALAASQEELSKTSNIALESLYKTNPTAAVIGKSARAIVIFPSIVRAGFVFGGSYGEGIMTKGNQFAGYYNSVSASWGWQIGAESYGYVVFLMNEKAVQYLENSHGWEIGVGPTVVVVNEGVAKNLSSTTLKDDAYAFIFDQKGLMVSLSLEGTKISRIKK